MHLISFLLFTAFAAVHSLTAAKSFKGRAMRSLGLSTRGYRVFYNLGSVLTFAPFAHFWFTHRLQAEVLYSFSGFPLALILLIKLGGAAFFLLAFLQSGALEFLGLKKEEKLLDSGLYGVVRHPQYLGGIIFLWASPVLNLLDLESYLLLTLYLVMGARLEEKKLVEEYPGYRDYQKEVPFLIPRLGKAD